MRLLIGSVRTIPLRLLVALCLATAPLRADPLVYVAIGTHSEDPGNADTGAALSQNLGLYGNFRHGIYLLAERMNSLGIPWNSQNDWNFIEGCRQWEITNPQTFPDPTGGLNVLRWLREVRGVELDAHSHEGFGYNYADAAWLLRTYFGVPDSELMVVGGRAAEIERDDFDGLSHPPVETGIAKLKTVSGDTFIAKAADDSISISDARGNTAMVTIADVMQKNGVIHVIDTVVMP